VPPPSSWLIREESQGYGTLWSGWGVPLS
jgi:hypothetical protein